MKIFKKKHLMEIIDSNGDLIGTNDVPTSGADLETQANGTTDVNAKKGQQPFRYDMLGRFGFTMMPFMEGKEENDEQKKLVKDLAELMYDKYMETLEYYYRNPNKLKSDFRIHSEHDFESQPEDKKKIDFEWARKAVDVVRKHFEDAFDEPKSLDETKVVEDKVVDKRSEDEISNKAEDRGVRDGKLEKIAGLINKLEKKDKDKLKNLLEAEEPKEETKFTPIQKQKIERFVKNYKGDFEDDEIHKFADRLGLDKHEVEEFIYSIARRELKK